MHSVEEEEEEQTEFSFCLLIKVRVNLSLELCSLAWGGGDGVVCMYFFWGGEQIRDI